MISLAALLLRGGTIAPNLRASLLPLLHSSRNNTSHLSWLSPRRLATGSEGFGSLSAGARASHYDVLGVTVDATTAQIKAAFRRVSDAQACMSI